MRIVRGLEFLLGAILFAALLLPGKTMFTKPLHASQVRRGERLNPLILRKPVGDPLPAIQGLVSRVLGQDYVSRFQFEVIPDQDGYDVFEIDGSEDGQQPVLRGNNGVALASGLNTYLKYMCNCSISWGREKTGDQLNLPSKLPVPTTKLRIESPVLYRYYQNVCTVSYSMAWWDFDRWQREIDWMAMNGLNLILSFTGQEYVWQKLYSSLGLTDHEIKTFFSGPAFFAWQRMGNIRRWGGPVDDDWIVSQAVLQKKIVNRIRLFGMINVFPGFAGHVPKGLVNKHPDANFTQNHAWGSFGPEYTDDWLLEPTDPLFHEVAVKYYRLFIQEFGTDHVFNCDTYNEMDPSNNNTAFLADTNKAIYRAMKSVDTEAVFLMQGWLFHSGFWKNVSAIEAFLSGVPDNKMIILDLNSEQSPLWLRTNFYFGKPFIWCMLHNFGGTRGVYGPMDVIAVAPVDALFTAGTTMIGTGITPEAIEHNPVMYDLMSEMGWTTSYIDLDTWVNHYAARRYGHYSPRTEKAWAVLKDSVYQKQWSWSLKSVVDQAPSFQVSTDTSFNMTALTEAWLLLYEAAVKGEVNSTVGPFQYDLVDIGRQSLVDLFYDVFRMFVAAYSRFLLDSPVKASASIAHQMQALSDVMLELILDIDAYLGTNTNFLLGHWIADARAVASNSSMSGDNHEFNARNQLTMWGPDQNIEDYASKHWSGLLKDYYHERWSLFTSMAVETVKSGIPFDMAYYNAKRFLFEHDFSYTFKSQYPTKPVGDVMSMTKMLIDKYVPSNLTYEDYKVIENVTINGSNVLDHSDHPWTQNMDQMAYLCSINSGCAGFTSDGQLKSSTSDQIVSLGTNLYVKKQRDQS